MTQNLMFVLESFRRHMDNGRWLFQMGMERAGFLSVGGEVPPPGVDSVDVEAMVNEYRPSIVLFWPRYEWNPAEWGGSEVTLRHKFVNVECLRSMPEITRVTVFHDAGSACVSQKRWHDDFDPDIYLTWYHERSVVACAPHVAVEKIVRTYHILDLDLPEVTDRNGVGCIPGASNRDVYPLRAMAERESKHWPSIDVLAHPGYHQSGTTSPLFVQRLAKYRVAVCTSSIYRFALRKIFEATAAGCRVVTNLTEYDVLPGIDGNLTRVPNDIAPGELHETIQRLADEWDCDKQREYSRVAKETYNWQHETERVAGELRKRHMERLRGMSNVNVLR